MVKSPSGWPSPVWEHHKQCFFFCFSLVEFSPYEGPPKNQIQYEKFQVFFIKKTRKSPDSEGGKGRKFYKSPDLDSELLQVKWPEVWPTLAHSSDRWLPPDHPIDKIQKNKTLITK
jgi:hypothetical protein